MSEASKKTCICFSILQDSRAFCTDCAMTPARTSSPLAQISLNTAYVPRSPPPMGPSNELMGGSRLPRWLRKILSTRERSVRIVPRPETQLLLTLLVLLHLLEPQRCCPAKGRLFLAFWLLDSLRTCWGFAGPLKTAAKACFSCASASDPIERTFHQAQFLADGNPNKRRLACHMSRLVMSSG